MSIQALRRDIRGLTKTVMGLVEMHRHPPVMVGPGPAPAAIEDEAVDAITEEIDAGAADSSMFQEPEKAAADEEAENLREELYALENVELHLLDMLKAADLVIERRADMDPHFRIEGRFTDAVNTLAVIRNRIKRERQNGKPLTSDN